MKKLLVALMMLIGSVGLAYSYTVEEFITDLENDTEDVFGRSLKPHYSYEFLNDEQRQGFSSPILAWKFLSVEPTVNFGTGINQVAEISVNLPLSLKKLFALGTGNRNAYTNQYGTADKDGGEWRKNLYVEPFIGHNFSTGKFGVGIAAGYSF